MAVTTGKISYNLNDRGYRFHGKPRSFDCARVASFINSPATQERVSGRAMFGFYGHWPRHKWGAVASEGGLDASGKQIVVEPAFVTTYLHAAPDGTITHEQEFLDNEPGQACVRLHKTRAGGFSSVIDEGARYMGGFDYVLDPNYRNNRGYTLDSATGGMIYDDAHGVTLDQLDYLIHAEQAHGMALVLDSANAAIAQRDALIRKFEEENETLLGMLAKKDPEAAAIFDSASHAGVSQLVMLDTGAARDLLAMDAYFRNANLGDFESLPQPERPQPVDNAPSPFLQRLLMG